MIRPGRNFQRNGPVTGFIQPSLGGDALSGQVFDNIRPLHPVVLAVPEHERGLRGPDKVAALRRCARQALAVSARISGVELGPLEKGDHGAPVPFGGVHWSLTHKDAYVAAVVAGRPVGIDIEKIKPFNPALQQRIAGNAEWALAPETHPALFFRYWTAKEAVLKAVGMGFVGLSECRIRAIVDRHRMLAAYNDQNWTVMQYWGTQEHIVSIAANHTQIVWHQMD